MINFLKTYIGELLYVAIFIVIIELILPKGNMKKYVYSVTSVIVLFLIISPIFNASGEANIKEAIDNVIETISKSTKVNDTESQTTDFNNFKDSVITTDVKERVEANIKEKLLTMGLEVQYIEIKVTDTYQFEEISIYIKNLGGEQTKSVSKASDAISMVAKYYEIESSKIKIVELGGNAN